MLPYNAYLSFGIGLILTLIPIAATWPGVELPPWVGLGLGLLTAAGAYTLKNMAPAADVHKDSELPPAALPPTAEEIAAAYDRLRRQRAEARLREVSGNG